MKKWMSLAASLVFTAALFAQTGHDAGIRPETVALVEKYNLDLAQTARMDKVMAQKASNLAEIEQFKASNPAKYRAKLLAAYQGSRASVGHVLTSKEQREKHRLLLVELREKRAAKEQELKKAGAKPEAIEQALLEIEAMY